MKVDLITVGGGLAGAALALALARSGRRVVVLEREEVFHDRVRGEGLLPWGVNEARDLGIYELLETGCGRPVRYWTSHSWANRPPRDLLETTPRGAPCLTFYHPSMQEVLLNAASEAGANVRRGIAVRGVETGPRPSVTTARNGHEERIEARLVVGADGRDSRVRRWTGFTPWKADLRTMVAGVLLDGVAVPDESIHVFHKPEQGEGALFFPLGEGRVRSYFIYRHRGERRGLSGKHRLPKFLSGCAALGVPIEWLDGATAAGPLAEFDGADTWVKRPYRDGVALVGDAASSNDPAWGNGLALTLKDVRTLSECLDSDDDWERACRRYAELHDEYFGALHRVTTWLTDLLYEVGREADARRERAFAAMREGRSRSPDYIALGPASPSDEAARRRMFGED